MGVMERLTNTVYEFREIRPPQLAVFVARNNGGQCHDELLRFYVLEARALMWEEALRHNPALARQDPWGDYNYRQYVAALVEAMKRDLL